MKIAIYCFEGITMFHMAVPQMVFGEVTRQGFDKWNVLLFWELDNRYSPFRGRRDRACRRREIYPKRRGMAYWSISRRTFSISMVRNSPF